MAKLPPLKSLVIFDAVARHLHFAKAANELNITPSAVSQQIKILETYLGCYLIKRDNKRVSLTPQGSRYYRSVHDALDIIISATETIKPTQSNTVHLEIATTLAMQWLIPNLPNLQLQHPDIELIISTNLSQSEQSQMMPDISIVPEVISQENKNHLLWADDLILIASPKIQEKTVIEAMQHHTAINVAHPMRTSDWQTYCKHMDLLAPKNTLVLSNTLQAIEAVKNNVGILVTHKPLVHHELDKNTLKIIGKAISTKEGFYLHYTPQRIPSTNARIVRDWLLNLVKHSIKK